MQSVQRKKSVETNKPMQAGLVELMDGILHVSIERGAREKKSQKKNLCTVQTIDSHWPQCVSAS